MRGVERHEEAPGPDDRLGCIADRMGDLFDAAPEREEGDRVLILSTPVSGKASALIHGYEELGEDQMLADLIEHCTAIFEAHGREMKVIPLGQG